ncbi:hypothetical protein CNMCM7691_004918 [Aspergillus felis]|uniref:C2H2-type domain-containing protein n=1 Tax=Aspergillus felis TaxID=1287682 RepID=A0A8H6R5J3_9EURO|nr:hypothetical protein CNMCM7691_004918 [Aspergillus felis]
MEGLAKPADPPTPVTTHTPGSEPAASGNVTWKQVEWVLNKMWWDYEQFVYECSTTFIPSWQTNPRSLEPRHRIRFHTQYHRHQGKAALQAASDARESLVQADEALRARCYQQPRDSSPRKCGPRDSSPRRCGPPTMPEGKVYNPDGLTNDEKQEVAEHLQTFRDSMVTAVEQVGAYKNKIEKDADKRKQWIDNSTKLVTTITALAWDPAQGLCMPPPPESTPVPGLPVYQGYRCPRCPYVAQAMSNLLRHQHQAHPEAPQPRPRRPSAPRPGLPEPLAVSYQRFFPAQAGSSFFQLQEALAEKAELDRVVPAPAQKHSTKVSPWLELTQWPRYLQGQNFTAVAALRALPDPTKEPLLVAFAGSVKQLINQAYHTIMDRRINKFDQIYLKPSTYQHYCQPIVLLHQLTTAQLAALDQMEEHAARLLVDPAQQAEEAALDQACLALSIALVPRPWTTTLLAHLRVCHCSHPTVATAALREAVLTEMLKYLWIDPTKRACIIPSPGDPPIPGLPVYQGYSCPHCSYIARTTETIQKHRHETHKDLEPPNGHGRQPQWQVKASCRLANHAVLCQRLFPSKHGSQYFKITCATTPPSKQPLQASAPMTPAEWIHTCVDQALWEGQAAAKIKDGQVPAVDPHPTAVSPWLELTRWPEYLQGQDLAAVVLLGCLPNPTTEPVLLHFSTSIKRLIDEAYQVIKDGHLNEFDQIQINTFFRKPSVWNRLIQIHLRPATYH